MLICFFKQLKVGSSVFRSPAEVLTVAMYTLFSELFQLPRDVLCVFSALLLITEPDKVDPLQDI